MSESFSTFNYPQLTGEVHVKCDSPVNGTENMPLNVCRECACEYVQHENAIPLDSKSLVYSISLECPNCPSEREAVITRDQLDDLDTNYEDGIDAMKELRRARDSEAIDHFAAALQQGHILPEDF